jgi:glycosyltransferase involved in cell wall biosynthesis
VVVGDGPLRGELYARATALGVAGAVQWAGAIDDAELRGELAKAELFVSAATYEGFGLAALEAMAAGAVPVVNDIEAFRDVIDHGQTGFLVNYGDAGPAATALREVLSLPEPDKLELSRKARAQALEFDWESAMPKFEEAYKMAAQAAKQHT